jgi:hypothetical protein
MIPMLLVFAVYGLSLRWYAGQLRKGGLQV